MTADKDLNSIIFSSIFDTFAFSLSEKSTAVSSVASSDSVGLKTSVMFDTYSVTFVFSTEQVSPM